MYPKCHEAGKCWHELLQCPRIRFLVPKVFLFSFSCMCFQRHSALSQHSWTRKDHAKIIPFRCKMFMTEAFCESLAKWGGRNFREYVCQIAQFLMASNSEQNKVSTLSHGPHCTQCSGGYVRLLGNSLPKKAKLSQLVYSDVKLTLFENVFS